MNAITNPYLFASISILFWSTLASVTVRMNHVPPFLLLSVAFAVGGLTGLAISRERQLSFKGIISSVYGVFGFHLFLFLAFRMAPPVETNLINYLWPLLLVLMTPLFIKEQRLGLNHILGGLSGFAGAYLLITGGKFVFDLTFMKGYLFALISGFTWASYTLISKRSGSFPSSNITVACLISSVFSFGVHYYLEPTYIPKATELISMAYLGVGPMGAAFFTWNFALKQGDPRIIGSLAYFTPFLSTVLLVLTTGDKLEWSSIAALLLIVGGAWISGRHKSVKSVESPV